MGQGCASVGPAQKSLRSHLLWEWAITFPKRQVRGASVPRSAQPSHGLFNFNLWPEVLIEPQFGTLFLWKIQPWSHQGHPTPAFRWDPGQPWKDSVQPGVRTPASPSDWAQGFPQLLGGTAACDGLSASPALTSTSLGRVLQMKHGGPGSQEVSKLCLAQVGEPGPHALTTLWAAGMLWQPIRHPGLCALMYRTVEGSGVRRGPRVGHVGCREKNKWGYVLCHLLCKKEGEEESTSVST